MHGYITRLAEKTLGKAIDRSPVVAVLGPRQCGKSTLAREFLRESGKPSVYLDLQNRSHRNILTEPELFFEEHQDDLVCLDEIQHMPEFFTVLRSEVDRNRRPGRFLILGSASRDLIQQSSESLAGRIALLDLTPFMYPEISSIANTNTFWLRGGFPESLLAGGDEESFDWRQDFIRTFLERDVPALGLSIPSKVMERLWLLLSHVHGQVVNYSKLAGAADLSVPTLKKYISILESTYMLRILPPCEANLKKRLIKSPKVYLRDSGILHALQHIGTFDDLLANPIVGFSWEGMVIEQIATLMPRWRPSFLRTSNDAEINVIMEKANRKMVFELKASKAPKPGRGFWSLLESLKPEMAAIVSPVEQPYSYRQGVRVENLHSMGQMLLLE